MDTDLRTKLERLILPIVQTFGYELWGMDLKPTTLGNTLRIYIESESGTTLDDCSKISHQISGVLDVEDPIAANYNLEVSSPGLDRTLFTPDQYKRMLGKNVRVKLFRGAPGERHNYVGKLITVTDEDITLEVDDKVVLLPFSKIEKTNVNY